MSFYQLSNNPTRIAISLLLSALLGAGIFALFQHQTSPASVASKTSEKQPLYWVAPMDANYRRDKPGKSPMGMDLIPVYQDAGSASEHGPGAVTIAPHVINNLGVRTAPARLSTMDTTLTTVGYVQYDQDQLVHIHPRVEGWIDTLHVKAAGDPVKKDQPLYTLYSPQLVNAQEEFLIALNRNNQALVTAAKARLAALQLSRGFIEELAQSRVVKQSITFYAPQSGVVDGLNIREGFFVKPGTTIMSIGKLDQVWVEAEVFERDVALVKAGLTVSMTLDYFPSKKWHGVVDYVYPALDAQTRTVRVRLKFDNDDLSLKPNMFAQVAIHARASEQSIIVPKESVIRTGKQDRVVLALGAGQFKSIQVKIGRVADNVIEVLAGLDDGDLVVTSAQFLIDSESSKSSDFMRMTDEQMPSTVSAQGTLNSIMVEHRMVNISHDPVAQWAWSEMTMDFILANDVDISELAVGQRLHFEMRKTAAGDISITKIDIIDNDAQAAVAQVSSATVNGRINTLDIDSRTINISRAAIEKWARPAATMDFILDDSIDITRLKPEMEISFTFEVRDELLIVALTPLNTMSDHQHADH